VFFQGLVDELKCEIYFAKSSFGQIKICTPGDNLSVKP